MHFDALDRLVDALDPATGAAGAGAASAVALALGAAVVAHAVRQAGDAVAAEQALALHRRACGLAGENARDHTAAREALDSGSPWLGAALAASVEVPLAVGAAAAELAELAAAHADRVAPGARVDLVAVVRTASAVASLTSDLVADNLTVVEGDPRVALASRSCERAEAALAAVLPRG